MMQNIMTALPILISLTTLFTFFRNELHKQQEYGKFLKEIEDTAEQVKILKKNMHTMNTRYRKWLEPLERQQQETQKQVHNLDKLTHELFVRLDSISSSIEEIKNIIKK